MATPIFRPARPDEAATLTALTLRSKAHWGYDADFMAACTAELTVHPAALEQPTMVVELAGLILGWGRLAPIDAATVELTDLFVAPEAIGHGYGRALLQHLRTIAVERGFRRMLVESDPYAADFYRAQGGRDIGTTPSGSIPGRELPLLEFALVDDQRRA